MLWLEVLMLVLLFVCAYHVSLFGILEERFVFKTSRSVDGGFGRWSVRSY
jgi:hypothetical protein